MNNCTNITSEQYNWITADLESDTELDENLKIEKALKNTENVSRTVFSDPSFKPAIPQSLQCLDRICGWRTPQTKYLNISKSKPLLVWSPKTQESDIEKHQFIATCLLPTVMFHSQVADNSTIREILSRISLVLDSADMQNIQSSNYLSRNHEPQPTLQALEEVAVDAYYLISTFNPFNGLTNAHLGIESINKRVGNCLRLCLAFYALLKQQKIKIPPLYLVTIHEGDHAFLVIDPLNKFEPSDVIDRESLSEQAIILDPWARTVIQADFPKRSWPQNYLGSASYKDESMGGFVSLPVVEPLNGKKYIVDSVLD